MDGRRSGSAMDWRIRISGMALSLIFLGVMASWLLSPISATAYEEYSLTRTAGNCADCHGDFRANGYVSANDNVAWNTSLHNAHRQTMLAGDCDACHFGNRFPVSLSQSDGGVGFAPIGCLGCHGRAEPAAGNAVKGTGLRQHHDRNGVAVCRDCHTDSNPANFVAAAETVAPPYYFTPDANHPSKPTQSCNGNGSESAVAPPRGLDNDGNNAYDSSDGQCNPSAVGDDPKAGAVLQLAVSGATVTTLRVSFNLPSGEAARLEAFDVAGRVVARREVGILGPGQHRIELLRSRVPSGLYLVRLTQGARSAITRAIILN